MTQKIIFMGSPAFALPSLRALIESDFDIVAVYSQPPRPAGRGKKRTPTPIHQLAEAHGIPIFTPEKLSREEAEKITELRPDFICVAAYGLLLPEYVLEIAPCLNVHPSALPRWRGAAPIQHTILSGDTTTDLCIMEMEKGLDTGPVYKRVPYDVGTNETAGELHDHMATEGAKHLLNVLENWPITPEPQPEEGVAYAHKITKDMCPINWTKSAQDIHNHIRGLSPFPGATTLHGDVRLKVLGSILSAKTTDLPAGQIISNVNNGIDVACGDGHVLTLTQLQRPGKKPQEAKVFLQGYSFEEESLFV